MKSNNIVALTATQTKKTSPKKSPPEQHDVAGSSSPAIEIPAAKR